ncbi:MAG: QueT transporter family protein [Synergistaceae bacterium]|jgi:uncharacterized membrane protein|nr:QueT transporter family protein [Synergistaceae bacterium]
MVPPKTLEIARGAIIAALYVAVTMLFQPLSYGPMQVRVSEALTLLPCLWLEAVPGLFVGCMIANILGGLGPWDVFLGSAATLIAAILTYFAPNRLLAASAPVLVNAVVVGWYLSFLMNMNALMSIFYVGCGEAIACFALGLPLVKALGRTDLIRQKK